jgi:hypothetical protein
MNRQKLLGMSVIAACGIALLPGSAMSQQQSLKAQLVGMWTLTSVTDVFEDGRTENSWGPAVKGAATYDANGGYMSIIIGADLPNPSARPQVSSRLVNASLGTYRVDDAAKTSTVTIERSTFPPFDGAVRTASVSIVGDQLTLIAAPIKGPKGTFRPHLVYKRAK